MVKIILEITASYRRKTIKLAEEGIGLTYDLEKANELLKNQSKKMSTKIHRYKSTKSTLKVLSNPITDDFCNFDEDDVEIPIYLADLIFDLATLSVYAAMNLGTNVTKKLDHNGPR